MDPVLCREVIEGQQRFSVFLKALGGLGIFGLIHRHEAIESFVSLLPTGRHPNLLQGNFGLGLEALGQAVEHVFGLVDPAALAAGLSVYLGPAGAFEQKVTVLN
jgi:hypothetical protein